MYSTQTHLGRHWCSSVIFSLVHCSSVFFCIQSKFEDLYFFKCLHRTVRDSILVNTRNTTITIMSKSNERIRNQNKANSIKEKFVLEDKRRYFGGKVNDLTTTWCWSSRLEFETKFALDPVKSKFSNKQLIKYIIHFLWCKE